jgi:hypothetical protein
MKHFKITILLLFISLFTRAQNGVYYIPSDKEADSARLLLSRTINDSLKMLIYYKLSSY